MLFWLEVQKKRVAPILIAVIALAIVVELMFIENLDILIPSVVLLSAILILLLIYRFRGVASACVAFTFIMSLIIGITLAVIFDLFLNLPIKYVSPIISGVTLLLIIASQLPNKVKVFVNDELAIIKDIKPSAYTTQKKNKRVNIYQNYTLEPEKRQPVKYSDYIGQVIAEKIATKSYSFQNSPPVLQKLRLTAFVLLLAYSVVVAFMIGGSRSDEAVHWYNSLIFWLIITGYVSMILGISIMMLGFARSLITLFGCGVLFVIGYFVYNYLDKIYQITKIGFGILIVLVIFTIILLLFLVLKHINTKRLTYNLATYIDEDFTIGINEYLKFALPIEKYDHVVKVTFKGKEKHSFFELTLEKLEYTAAAHNCILAIVKFKSNEPYAEVYVITANTKKAKRVLERYAKKNVTFHYNIEVLSQKPEDIYNTFYPTVEQMTLENNRMFFDYLEYKWIDLAEVPVTFTAYFADNAAAQACSEILQKHINFDEVEIIDNSEYVQENHLQKIYNYILCMMKIQPLNRVNIDAQCKLIIFEVIENSGQFNNWYVGTPRDQYPS